MAVKRCVLYPDRECTECGECNRCDLDPSKICDNCGKCIGLDGSLGFRALKVDGIIREDMNPDDYLYDEETLDDPGDAPDDQDDFFWDPGAFVN